MLRNAFFGESEILEGLFPLGEKGCNELLKEAVEAWSLEDMGFRIALATRDLDSTDKLPKYPYRDDSMLIWCAISEFVAPHVDCSYVDGESVQDDYEVQNFLKNSFSLYYREDVDEDEVDAPNVNSKESLATMAAKTIRLSTGYQMGLLKGLYEN